MDASFVTTSKRLQRLCNFTRESITKILNQSRLYMFFSSRWSKLLRENVPKAPKHLQNLNFMP